MASCTPVLIKNGLVIDPANGINQQLLDVLVVDGRVARVSSTIPESGAKAGSKNTVAIKDVFDASGCIVCPGLIDLHVHCYPEGTPLGVDPDEHCLTRGVTTVVDAGSAGLFVCLSLLSHSPVLVEATFSLL